MKKNWIVQEAQKADPSESYLILEKPDEKKFLDNLLLTRFYPEIVKACELSGYEYLCEPKTQFELSHRLERSLLFLLSNENISFSRAKLRCSLEAWMIEREFFLSLRKDNNINVILEVLGNSRFTGSPPSLLIYKDDPYFYQITINAGEGKGWGISNKEEVDEMIQKVVDVNVALYEMIDDGYLSSEKLGAFLEKAFEIYKAY